MRRDRIDALADELFAAAREERPDRALLERVERASGSSERVPLDSSAPPSVRSRRFPRIGRRPFPGRTLLAALVCGAVAALLLLPRAHDDVLISAERSPAGATPTPTPEPTPSPASVSAREATPQNGIGPSEPASVAPSEPPPSARTEPARAAPAPMLGPAPRARVVTSRTPAPPSAPESAAPPASGAESPSATTPAPTTTATPTLANELGALKQIRQALRNHDGSAALVLLDRYDTGEYGTSLALEARVLRVEALDSSGHHAEAAALARRFVRDNPDSPLAERAQRFIDGSDPARGGASARPR